VSIAFALGATLVAWSLLALVTRVTTAGGRPRATRAGNGLGPEPPAVAGLLLNGWRPAHDGAAATLLDLAARGHVRLTDRPDGELRCRVPGVEPPDTLAPFEQLLRGRVGGRLAGGAAPAGAVLPDHADEDGRRWYQAFDAAVIAEARRLGVVRDRLPRAARWSLRAAAAVPAALLGWLVASLATVTSPGLLPEFVGFVGWMGLCALVPRGLRGTAAGRAAAGRWLAVRADVLADPRRINRVAPSDGPLDRRLAWAAALGAAPEAVAALTPAEPRLAWSSAGGSWRRIAVGRRVRGRSPAAPPGPLLVGLAGLLPLVLLGAVGLWLLALSPSIPGLLLLLALLAAWVAAIVVSALAGRRHAAATARHRTVTGQVVRRWADTDGSGYLAVDDGQGGDAVVWAVDPAQHERFPPGSAVRLTLDRGGRLVDITGSRAPGAS
jgi:Predicted membrane protein (DUF2207)